MTTGHASDDQPDGIDLDELARRARKRWLLLLASSVAVGVATAAALPPLIGSRHARPRPQHHNLVGVAIAMCLLAASLAVLAVIIRKIWRNQGMFAPPLIVGLKRKDRRTVSRAVRRGFPSNDPKLAPVEEALAQRVVKQARTSVVCFVIALSGEGTLALVHARTVARIFYGGSAVMFTALLVLQLMTLRGARRYLARTAGPSAATVHTC
jgi:hypothetical protein